MYRREIGCLGGGGEGLYTRRRGERELSDRRCRPYAAGEYQKSPRTFPVKKNKGLQQPREQRTALLAYRLPKMSSTETTPDGMVVVQHKDSNCSNENSIIIELKNIY